MSDNKSIVYFSENIFDREIYNKSEIRVTVRNLIKTINLLIPKGQVNTNIQDTIIHFGISDEHNYDSLSKYLGKSLWIQLKEAMGRINENLVYSEYLDIAKYSKRYRESRSSDLSLINRPTLVDLFCGSGGLSLGLVQSGFRIIFANDIEKSALQTYSFNHPEIIGKNITMGGIEEIAHHIKDYVSESVDVLAGGPPCQGFSMANRQRIIDDPRNILYKYYVESVRNLKPKIFIMENVKGMLKVAPQVVEDFNNKTDIGYDIKYHILNAKDFNVPQNRERLIYIGIRKDLNSKLTAEQIFSKIMSKKRLNSFVLKDAIEDLRPLKASRVKNSTNIDNLETGSLIEINQRNKEQANEYVNLINKNKTSLIFNHKARYNNDRDILIYGRMIPGDKSDSPRIADIMPYKSRSDIFKDKYYKLLPNKICKTITAHMKFDCNMYIHPTQARGLTPREAARVQSYPDDFFFLGPFTKTYQQIGNSVPPLMAKVIGEEIIKYL